MSACKDCKNLIRQYWHGYELSTYLCRAHPLGKKWDAYDGRMYPAGYKQCEEINVGPHNCPDFKPKDADYKVDSTASDSNASSWWDRIKGWLALW